MYYFSVVTLLYSLPESVSERSHDWLYCLSQDTVACEIESAVGMWAG